MQDLTSQLLHAFGLGCLLYSFFVLLNVTVVELHKLLVKDLGVTRFLEGLQAMKNVS